jgi:hypothetical protein
VPRRDRARAPFDPRRLDRPEAFSWWTDDRLGTPDGVWFGGDGKVWAVDTVARNAIVRCDPQAAEPQRWSFFGAPPQVQGPFDIKSPDPPTAGCGSPIKRQLLGRIRTV